MKHYVHICSIVIFFFASTTLLSGQVRITEAMSNSGSGGTNDWIELTNYGTTDVSITGWKMDDNSFSFTTAVELIGIATIPAGKSVVFLETDAPSTDIPAFRTFWGSTTNNVTIGSYASALKAVSMSSSGDGAIIFNAAGTEIHRINVPAATAGKSFYCSYKTDGTVNDNVIVSALGTINGTISNQITIASANVLANVASPGTALIFPISAGVNNPEYKSWVLFGNRLKFEILPSNWIEVYAITGSKIAVYEPAKEINLNLNKGLYVLKIDNKATKIMIK